jgi:hypothetical protein
MRYKFANDIEKNILLNGYNVFNVEKDGESLHMDFTGDKMIDLSGGLDGKYMEKVYTAPNGTVVTSEFLSWDDGTNYRLEYLFNNSIQTALNQYDRMWLSSNPQYGNGSESLTHLTFDFTNYTDYSGIRRAVLYPTTRSDGRVKYLIEASIDGINWEVKTQVVDSRDVPVGTSTDHVISVPPSYKFIRLTLEKMSTYWTFDEIQLFEPDLTVPFDPNKSYLLGSSPKSNITLRNNAEIKDINVDSVLPLGSDIRTLLTFDGGKTFFKHNNLAYNHLVKANGTLIVGGEYDTVRTPSTINDGDNTGNSYWLSPSADALEWIGFQFDVPKRIGKIRIQQNTSYDIRHAVVESSDDGITWNEVVTVNDIWNNKEVLEIFVPISNPATHWRLRSTTSWSSYTSAFEFHMEEFSSISFEQVDLSEISTNGMTLADLTNIPTNAFMLIRNATFNIYLSAKVSSSDIRPRINKIDIDVVQQAGSAMAFSGEHYGTMSFVEVNSIADAVEIDYSKKENFEAKHFESPKIGDQIPMINFMLIPSTMASTDAPITRPIKEFLGVQYGVGVEKTPPFQPRLFPKHYHPAIFNGQIPNNQPINNKAPLAIPNGADGKPLGSGEVSKYWKSPDRRQK